MSSSENRLNRLNLQNLPFNIVRQDQSGRRGLAESDVVEWCAQLGVTIDGPDAVSLCFDARDGNFRGFGFIQLRDDTDAVEAIGKLNNQLFGGREVRCAPATPRPAHHASRRF